jgi:ABC-type uncharacterized transport system permease subunit
MSLSPGSALPVGALPLLPAGVAIICYAVATLPAKSLVKATTAALVAAWLLHFVVLVLDVGGWGAGSSSGARLGFASVLSITVWLVIAVHEVESRFVPLPTVRVVLAPVGAWAVLLAVLFPAEPMLVVTSPWAPLHFALGVASYGLLGAAALHAVLLDAAERRLRGTKVRLVSGAAQPADTALGMPLMQLERLTFRFVEAGFVVLTVTLLLGVLTTTQWRWDHKTVFSLLGWAVFAALLSGRHLQGWRGRRATRWLYAGTALLLLGYAGSRFVIEVLLGPVAR